MRRGRELVTTRIRTKPDNKLIGWWDLVYFSVFFTPRIWPIYVCDWHHDPNGFNIRKYNDLRILFLLFRLTRVNFET
jgi:hypothetical protein